MTEPLISHPADASAARPVRCHVIVPAAGNGFRYGASAPKQYLSLLDKPVLQHALDRLTDGFPSSIVHVVIARDDHWFDERIDAADNIRVLRCGGVTRPESVRNAVGSLQSANPRDWVVVHDAVRPCLDRAAVLRLRHELVDDAVGGFLAVPVSDTLKRIGDNERVVCTESREALWRAQTPQMFRYDVLRQALDLPGFEFRTDEAHAVEALGLTPRVVIGSACNVKITYPEDMQLAAAILMAENRAS
ncbi:MAG: 2-C-methyl-D-erythritol 4-phosphate cytidylyltransferase [Burkholderiaceae bacterium]